MKISFVVPAYNEEALIIRSLAAIRAEIERAGCAAEIIVVNNASTDATAEVAASVDGVSVIDEPVKSLVRARNTGFLRATGDLIANIDADTILQEGWLAKVLEEFSGSPDLVALSGPYTYYDVPAWVNLCVQIFYGIAFAFYLLHRFVLRIGSLLQGGNFVVRRSAMHAIGGYNLDFSFYGEDTDLARRLNAVGIVKFSFRMSALSSGRRLAGEGLIRTGLRYSANFFWATFLKRPFTYGWLDIRSEHPHSSHTYRIASEKGDPLGASLTSRKVPLLLPILRSVIFLFFSFILNFFAAQFATVNVSNPVTDIILDNIPVINVDIVFVEGAIIFWMFVLSVMLLRPGAIPFVLKSIALFTIIRSFFIILTHIGPFPIRSGLDPSEVMRIFTSGGDLFFSGHVGSAFLLALIFWQTRALRLIFIAVSMVFACGVLIGHLHYSIDVFAAFFITYGIADLAKYFFQNDYELFQRLDHMKLPSLAAIERLAAWRKAGR